MKRILIAAGIAAVTSVGAQAADLGARPYTKATPAVAAVYDWTGFYVGGNVGYGWGENTDPGLSLVNPGNDGGITTFLTTGFPGSAAATSFRTSTRTACWGVCRSVMTGSLVLGY